MAFARNRTMSTNIPKEHTNERIDHFIFYRRSSQKSTTTTTKTHISLYIFWNIIHAKGMHGILVGIGQTANYSNNKSNIIQKQRFSLFLCRYNNNGNHNKKPGWAFAAFVHIHAHIGIDQLPYRSQGVQFWTWRYLCMSRRVYICCLYVPSILF